MTVSMKHRKPKLDHGYTDASELQTEWVLVQLVEGQISRADIKAEITLTVNTLLIASTALIEKNIASHTLLNGGASLVERLVALFSMLMFASLLVSTYFSLLAVLPRIKSAGGLGDNFFYFGSISYRSRQDFIDSFSKKQQPEIKEMMLQQVHALASIAQRKFQLIRVSLLLLFAAVTFWALARLFNILVS